MDYILITLFTFLYGLLIGSFLNVCIYRIPLEETVVKGRSYCPSCHSLIPWYCNVPLFSYLFLRGRCKDCKNPISPLYPAVELLNGLLYVVILQIYGLSIPALFMAILFSILIIITFIDLKHQIIPDGLVLILLITGILHSAYQIFMLDSPWHLWVIGFFAASLPLFILALIYPDGMGGGDIKLMAVSGLFLGWNLILLSLFIGALLGSIVSLFIILRKKGTRKTALPFGPMLAMGIIACSLWGNQLLTWYLILFL